MNCRYLIYLTKHPVDGLKLALKAQNGAAPRLTLVLSGGTSCALAYGFSTPNDYSGLAGLLHYAPAHLASSVEFEGARHPVVFPAGHGAGLSPASEFLDRLRPKLTEWTDVNLVMEYPRIESDLPPLSAADRVTCFWEIRDMLTDGYVDQINYLSERILNEQPHFAGLQLYARGPAPENAGMRKTEIEKAAQIITPPELLMI